MTAKKALKRAYYTAQVTEFVRESPQAILGALAAGHPHDLEPSQRMAWVNQIEILQKEMALSASGWIAFEFSIPRMGRRADVIMILNGVVFVLEFKIGALGYDSSAINQAIDYCMDLKNFHAGSHDQILVPVVVATCAKSFPAQLPLWPDNIAKPILTNGSALLATLTAELCRFEPQGEIDPAAWMASAYKPTPTIIEAAQALYGSHQVDEITRSGADEINLTLTTERLSKIIIATRENSEKAICFVTGVPGAGKTLAGLNLAVQYANRVDERGVFLSGNDPLVEVLREALARDEFQRLKDVGQKAKIESCRSKVKSFIQNIHYFRDDNLMSDEAPFERVVIFDESQRAWDASHLSKFMARKKGIQSFDKSEPQFLIDVFDRHLDWCAIICLVGGGQEINAGEAGLPEWLNSIQRFHPNWKVYISDHLEDAEYRWNSSPGGLLKGVQHSVEPDLHLAVSLRSFRAKRLSEFMNAVMLGDCKRARLISEDIGGAYPLYQARDLSKARRWLRESARGSERFGLIAYSGSSRLKAEGVNVHEKIDAPVWFLNDRDDVRSSFYLEDPATEFDIQGLELDWACMCWDICLRRDDSHWSHYQFRGTNWQRVSNFVRQNYLVNSYRVLLTRARQGLVIYVPMGDDEDPTRPPAAYQAIANYLTDCGIPHLPDSSA